MILMQKLISLIKQKPYLIFYSVLFFIGLSVLLTILVDIVNIFNVKAFMNRALDVPYFWYHWFTIPLEIPLQWYLLGSIVVVFAMIAGGAYERNEKQIFYFWFLLSLGVVLMIVEDAGNVRHEIRWMIESVADEEQYGFFGTISELLYFAIIGVIMLFALIRYRNVYWHLIDVKKYLFLGYLFYGLGVASSFLGSAFESVTGFSLYEKTGTFIMDSFFLNDEKTELTYEIALETMEDLNFMFMDKVYEESLELIGAGALLTAGFFFLFSYMGNKSQKNQ